TELLLLGVPAPMTNYPSPPPPDSAHTAAPTCPRHPDRVSYVRCQRCGRPACPECQRPAAVGVHCVDCVHEANKTSRAARTVLGGRISASNRPVANITFMGLSVLLFVAGHELPIFALIAFDPSEWVIQAQRMQTSAC